jgi:hypothetical protein
LVVETSLWVAETSLWVAETSLWVVETSLWVAETSLWTRLVVHRSSPKTSEVRCSSSPLQVNCVGEEVGEVVCETQKRCDMRIFSEKKYPASRVDK